MLHQTIVTVSHPFVQRYYSHCISCNERLLINSYVSDTPKNQHHGTCPKCGQPEPVHERFVPFPPIKTYNSCLVAIGITIIVFLIFTIVFLSWDSYMYNWRLVHKTDLQNQQRFTKRKEETTMKGAKCPYCESKIPMFHVFFKGKNYQRKKRPEIGDSGR